MIDELKIKELANKFPELNFEKIEHRIFFDDEDDEDFHYNLTGFKGNPELSFYLSNENDLDLITEITEFEFEFVPSFLAVKFGETIEFSLKVLNPRTSFYLKRRLSHSPIEISLSYYSNDLKILISFDRESDSLLSKILTLKNRKGHGFTLQIEGLKRLHEESLTEDVRKIINCIMFDLNYSFDLLMEVATVESLNRSTPKRRRRIEIPNEEMPMIYKSYIPELLEYFHIGDRVDYPPFRFICYFHIIEYFSDKSAYFLAAKKLKSLILKPDFHIKTDKYVNQAINFFKTESTKFTGDKVKIKRVLNQFIDKTDFEEYLRENELYDYFTQECVINCHKELILPPIDFSSDAKFEESLTKRIYSMRCSIVHSNPDFDETKAIPFKASNSNIIKLRKENEMIYGVARQIILDSKE